MADFPSRSGLLLSDHTHAKAASESWHQAQGQLAAAKANVDARLAELARTLKGQGYTLKDIGAITGYTFQRIAQILK